MDWFNIFVIVVVSFVGGFFGGQVGGGGLITLPMLMALGIPTPNAIAVNKFGGIFLNAFSASYYIRNKKLPLKMILWFSMVCVIGAAIGSYLILTVNEVLLKQIVVFVLISLLIIVSFRKDDGLIERHYKITKKHLIILVPILFLLGIYGGAIGIAGTTFFALFFVFQGQSFTQSMGFSCFIMAVISVVSVIIFVLNGVMIWQYAIPQAISISIGGILGAKYAIKKGNKWVKYLFISVSAILTVNLLYSIYLA